MQNKHIIDFILVIPLVGPSNEHLLTIYFPDRRKVGIIRLMYSIFLGGVPKIEIINAYVCLTSLQESRVLRLP